MKWYHLCLFIYAVFYLSACESFKPKNQVFTLKGKLSGIEKARKLTISYRDSTYNQIIDTLYVTADTFTYTRAWQEPTILHISGNEQSSYSLWLMVEAPQTIEIKGDIEALSTAQTSDYQGKKEWEAYQKMLEPIERESSDFVRINEKSTDTKSELWAKIKAENDSICEWKKGGIAKDFVKKYPNSLTSVYLAATYLISHEPEHLQNYVDAMSKETRNGKYGQYLVEILSSLKTLEIGQKAPNFTQNDVNDKPFSLTQYQGKYVLIDFWASWCGPCRKENPNVVQAYTKYQAKGFEVLGVSLDKDKSAWLAAIEKDKLAWTQVSDLKFWQNAAARLYNIRSIPSNVLIDPQGIIIARNLRGEKLTAQLQILFP
ncbi:MAG: redoxin domain-containing protein [Bacteroidia bacterium]